MTKCASQLAGVRVIWQHEHSRGKKISKNISTRGSISVTHKNMHKGETVPGQNDTIRVRRNKNIESIINFTCDLVFVRSVSFPFKQKME